MLDGIYLNELNIENMVEFIISQFFNQEFLDLSDITWIEPGPLLTLKVIKNEWNKKYIRPRRVLTSQYINDMYNKDIKRFKKGKMPIIVIKNRSEIEESTESIVRVLEFEYRNSLNQEDSEDLTNYLHHVISEILGNAFDHSNSNRDVYCFGQHYPNLNKTQVAVLDLGIGIPGALEKKFPDRGDDSKYILYATEPYITGVIPGPYGNTTRNIGWGLFYTKRFIEQSNGKLVIISRNGYASFGNTNTGNGVLPEKWPGTLLAFEVNGNNINLNQVEFANLLGREVDTDQENIF